MPPNLMPDQTAEEVSRTPRRFDFMRDSFAFANELVWEYQMRYGVRMEAQHVVAPQKLGLVREIKTETRNEC